MKLKSTSLPERASTVRRSWASALAVLVLVAGGCTVERERMPHAVGESRIHEDGISDPDAPGFHGVLLRETGYDFGLCARCHGDDYTGGAAESSCIECHAEGPTGCETCHATLLESGAHAAHLPDGALRFTACGGCHVVPSDWRDAGHLFSADGTLDPPPAEVALSGLGALRVTGSMEGEARYDAESGSCQAVYCHGGVFSDAAATNTAPRWAVVGMGEAECGTCHGTPPADHASGACRTCHGDVVDDAGNLIDETHHVDGAVDLGRDGRDPEACDACHGMPSSAAPPLDLLGRTSTSLVGVGAHQVHLIGAHRLSTPIACDECHRVPSTLDDAGHIDSALPAEVTFGALARTGGAAPTWLAGATRCANVYCHGGGPAFASDASPTRMTTPGWTALHVGVTACGACHGVPPLDAAHDPSMTLRDCATCHPSVDDYGNVLFTGERSSHIDGSVDVR